MSRFVDVQQLYVVVFGAFLGLRWNLGCAEDTLQHIVVDIFLEVRINPRVHRLLALFEGEDGLIT